MSKMLPNAFPRIPNNAYFTPIPALEPLLLYLERDKVRTFAEPCCGDLAIVRALEAAGYTCVSATDILDGHDARQVKYRPAPDAIITNPPYDRTRAMMKEIIHHLRKLAPTWLLLESDFAFNKGAANHIAYCSDIVAIGRVKWIHGSLSSGTANYAWYRFGNVLTDTVFHPQR